LREFDLAMGKDLSMNRCGPSTETFNPLIFRIGNPTPSKLNDCSGSYFVYENRIIKLSPSLIKIPPNSNPTSCESEIEPQIYESMTSDSLNKEVYSVLDLASQEPCTSSLIKETSNAIRKDIDIAAD
jgi:hypothetical protein